MQYKHSLNRFGALPVTEKAETDPQLMAETTLTVPFRLAGQPFYYEGVMRGFINADKADEMDYESLSGRYSVRGYPFSHSMSAARAFISRNEVVWQQVLRDIICIWQQMPGCGAKFPEVRDLIVWRVRRSG